MNSNADQFIDLRNAIKDRWNVLDWKLRFPWWGPPPKCRILMYADGVVQFNAGTFQGLQYINELLTSRAYFYVDFEVSFANRDGSDPSATIPGAQKLTDLDIMNSYDQIWFFGYNGGASLQPDEVALMDQFMGAPKFGGVLHTGDHADLGQALASQITRVGTMRLYPAPPNVPYTWNTTLVERPPASGEPADPLPPNNYFNFNDQSDDVPQTIRWRQYPSGGNGIFRRSRPHPILCGPDGPIDIIPDHQHEGEALAPTPLAGDAAWPTKSGNQEAPQVIAWGRIKDPTATKFGQEIGVLSAYDGHNVDVGRIVADSTWHHWFDINQLGLLGSGAPYQGFVATPKGQAALKKIDAYHLNIGVWLAPPDLQAAMLRAAWWSIIWSNPVVELPGDAPIWYYGQTAIDALGRRASRCMVVTWVYNPPIYWPVIPWWEWIEYLQRFQIIELPVEQYLAGGILFELSHTVGVHGKNARFPERSPSAAVLDKAIDAGVKRGLKALVHQLKGEVDALKPLIDSGFDPQAVRARRP